MLSKTFSLEAIFICLFSLLPWPETITPYCSRDSSSFVRKIVQSKLLPIFSKYEITSMPIECPFHLSRDLFFPQENAKIKHRPTQFTCGLCGKSFYKEKFLDQHFDNRHFDSKFLNYAEDAVCLADFCNILRCDVLMAKDFNGITNTGSPSSTDIEIYNEATALVALQKTGKLREPPKPKTFFSFLTERTYKFFNLNNKSAQTAKENNLKRRRKILCKEKEKRKNFDNSNMESEEDIGNMSIICNMHDKKKFFDSEMQRKKSNCKSSEILMLRNQCENLIRSCMAGIFLKLSIEDFKNMESEMNRAICFYLTCERYWEDEPHHPFPFALVFILVIVLSLGLCLCYYIIWILFDTDEVASSGYKISSSYINSQENLPVENGGLDQKSLADEYFLPTADVNDQFITISYPAELTRISDSIYDRTSRI